MLCCSLSFFRYVVTMVLLLVALFTDNTGGGPRPSRCATGTTFHAIEVVNADVYNYGNDSCSNDSGRSNSSSDHESPERFVDTQRKENSERKKKTPSPQA